MADQLTFEVGQGFTVTVRSYDELDRWLKEERALWNWLRPGDGRTDRFNLAQQIHSTWNTIFGEVDTFRNRGERVGELADTLSTRFNGPMLASPTPDGTTVLEILDEYGDEAAAFAGAVLKRQTSPSNAGNREEFMGMLMALVPDLAKSAHWSEKLKRERANFRQAARDLAERVDREADERRALAVRQSRRLMGTARRVFAGRRRKWRELQDEWQVDATGAVATIQDEAKTSIDAIDNTNSTYVAFMKLKAPVEYWNEKKGFHEGRETRARRWLYAYFPTTIVVLTVAFFMAGNFLINHPAAMASNAPVALYVVVSGGLLLLTTLAFWIGRLLTKLYLSEHHLRNDSEERAVMTTTYLALYHDGDATDVDRQLILAALFRATPDGIVKDDGPSDLSLQGILSKLLTR